MRTTAALLAAVAALVFVGVATASDAQVKAAVGVEIAAIQHQKGTTLLAAITKAHASLQASTPTTPAGKSAKALALRAAEKASLAASEQVKSDAANTKMDYPGATKQTALAVANLKAAKVLVNSAAAKLGLGARAK